MPSVNGYWSMPAAPSGSGSRSARIHTSCAVVAAPVVFREATDWRWAVDL